MTTPVRLLLVEDLEADAELILLELRRGGYEPSAERVETAAGFRSALAGGAWDVILCDNSLPGFDAGAALTLLGESGLDVPLIVVSGTIGEQRAVELMRAGAADYLMKDSMARLAPAVEREVREATSRRALRQAEREARDLAAIVESSDDAIVGKTLDGTVTHWNAGAERLYGYAAGEIVGHSISPLISPDRPYEEAGLLGRVACGERVEHFETERVRKDGTRVHVSVTLSPVRDDAGRVVGASAIARDITRRKLADERQARDALILAGVREAVVVTDPGRIVTYWNNGAERLFGWTAAEMVGRPYADQVPQPDRSWVADEIGKRVGGEEWFGEYESRRKDGSRVWIDARVSPITDAGGAVVGILGLSHEITNRKRAEDSLRASEARLARAQTVAKIGSWETDLATLQVTWSDETYRIFEVQPEQEQLSHQRFLEFVHPEDRAAVDEAFVRSQGHRLPCRIIHRGVTPGGRIKFLEECWQTQGDDRGEPVRVVGTCQDVTVRKQAEDAVLLSEVRYRSLIEATAAIVWTSPASGEFDSDQPGWTAFTGQTVEQHRGWGWLEVVHPDDRAESARAWATAVSTRTVYRVEHRLRRADGEYRHMAVRAVPILDPGGAIREWVGVHTDITEQKRASDAIRESEENFRTLAQAVPQIVWMTRPDGWTIYFNQQWMDYTGLTLEESLGHGWNKPFHPDDQRRAWDAWQHATATTGRYELECRLHRADGEYRWWLIRGVPLLAPDGAVLKWFGTCTDIHDFKQAQAERYAALARLNLQIERMPLAYLLSGPDFRYTHWNPAAERTFGFSQAEVLGKHPFEVVVPPQSRSTVADIFARLQAGDMDAHGVCENVMKDGRTITCEWYNTPLFGPDGTFQGLLSLAQDITARRRAEHDLLLRDRAIRAVAGGILITDATAPDNPISYVSPGFEQMTGYTGAEAIGRNCRFLQGKDTDPVVVAEVREAVRQGLPCDVELLNYLKDGTPFWNALSISPVRDDAGRLTNFIGVQTDVTGRRKLENQFHQAQKMEAVGQLAGGVAHDFNNLLTVINGYSEIVYDALPPGHPSREFVAEITSAGERAAGLTRQLLAFSRQSVLEPKVLDPNALVRDVEKLLRRLIGEDIDVTVKLAPDLGRVKADPGQLEQAVVNLCVNARDAMPTGGKLTVETRNVELDAGYLATNPDVRPGPYVVVAVSDTGTGMTPDVQARIFEPFFTTKEQGKGTGLGLAMVFGFVKQSGGHVGVHSEVGWGTTFKLYLPRVGDAPLAGKSGVRRVSMPRGTETVLLVEDEDAVRALSRHVLQMCGYTVLEARHGRDAIRVTEGHAGPVHLLVTDVVMPGGMSGRDVAEAVKARDPQVRVLFTSGYADDAVVRHGIQEEGTHFLQKPFTPAALAQKVRDVLDSKA